MSFNESQPLVGLAVLAASAFVCSLSMTAAVRRYALHRRVIDTPNDRSSHTIPTPRGGGAAIVGTMLLTGMFGAGMGWIAWAHFIPLALGMVAIAAVGWLDDTAGLRPVVRLAAQFSIALWTVIMLHGLPAVRTGLGDVSLGPVGYILAMLGIMWSINLFNFMDGIDGLAGSQSCLIFGIGGVLLIAAGSTSLGVLSLLVAASSLGFLVWNWPPAKIFLGDVGSTAMGYMLAGLAIASENTRGVPLLVFAILGGVLIVDATVTLARRVSRGHHPAVAHRDHAYQRLSRAWQGHRPVSIAAAVTTSLLGCLAAAGAFHPALLFAAFTLGWGLLAILLWVIEKRYPMLS
jgi:Fuc2NAc and GlcNAc transferase